MKIETGTEELLLNIENKVAIITLNRPSKKNALSDRLTPALRQVLLEINDKPSINSVIITGAGDAFCAGGDVGGMGKLGGSKRLSTAELEKNLMMKQEELTLRLFNLSMPTIAVISGPAAGAGVCIALACDFRFMASHTFLTTAYRNIALSGDYGGSWLLSRLVGLSMTKELFYTARRVGAKEALALGIVDKIFPSGDLLGNAISFANSISKGPKKAISRMKQNINSTLEKTLAESMRQEAKNLIQCLSERDHKEAVQAFLEKREPDFS